MASICGPEAEFHDPRRQKLLQALNDAQPADTTEPTAWACLPRRDIDKLKDLLALAQTTLTAASALQNHSIPVEPSSPQRPTTPLQPPPLQQPPSAQGSHGKRRNSSGQLTHTRSKVQQDLSVVENSDSSKNQAPLDRSSDTPPAKRQRVINKVPVVENTDSVKDEDSGKKDLEIVEFNEIFAEKDDDFEFSHTKIIMQHKGQFFYATTKARIKRKDDIDPSQLDNHEIPHAHVYPILPTPASVSFSPDIFIKRPSLISYADSKSLTEISRSFMHEAQMCERIKKSPHPNVAQYFGCLLDEHESISGLCFKKYDKTLHQMVKAGEPFDRHMCLSSIKAGIEHLHNLGIIHCDINPHNIFSDKSTFVVGDFDSSMLEGDELGMKAGTDGWTNDDFDLAQRENDWFGFGKIEEFLSRMKARK